MSTDKKTTQTNAACESGLGTAAVAFLVGATAGVAAGIMLAPKATEMVSELQNSAAAMAEKGCKVVDDAVETGAMEAHEAIDTTVAAVRLGAKKSHDAVTEAAGAMHSAIRT